MSDQEVLLYKHLETAHAHAARALDVIYEGNSPIRKWWWRRKLLKAEALLMNLVVTEARKNGSGA